VFEAHAADQIPYIERLAEYWGESCGSGELASDWADRLIGITRLALSPDKSTRGHFHGTSTCVSVLYTAGRHDELIELTAVDVRAAYSYTVTAATAGVPDATRIRIRALFDDPAARSGSVASVIGKDVDLD
jgi:hypothetical protein